MTSIRVLHTRIANLERAICYPNKITLNQLDDITRMKFLRCLSDNELNQISQLYSKIYFSRYSSDLLLNELNMLVEKLFNEHQEAINQMNISSTELKSNKIFLEFVRTQSKSEIDKFLIGKIPNSIDSYLKEIN